MSFGFSNALVALRKPINVLCAHLGKCAIVFIDDIMIYSRSREEHAEHLWIMLGKLGKHQWLLAE